MVVKGKSFFGVQGSYFAFSLPPLRQTEGENNPSSGCCALPKSRGIAPMWRQGSRNLDEELAMKLGMRNLLTATAVSLVLAWPAAGFCQIGEAPTEPHQKPQTPPPAARETAQSQVAAQDMVPGTVALTRALDAKKDHDGSQFDAKLTKTVHLKNGKTLPKGSTLLGTVNSDDMHTAGKAKLAVRFTQAKLPNGETVPIKATIVQVFPPVGLTAEGAPIPDESGPSWDMDYHTNQWSRQQLNIDQVGALKNVDLHSRLASQNSGVFVSTKKDDVKLMKGSRLELALAEQGNGQQAQNQQ
jgi:hypothetical protein